MANSHGDFNTISGVIVQMAALRHSACDSPVGMFVFSAVFLILGILVVKRSEIALASALGIHFAQHDWVDSCPFDRRGKLTHWRGWDIGFGCTPTIGDWSPICHVHGPGIWCHQVASPA